jgi:hypothetical protein
MRASLPPLILIAGLIVAGAQAQTPATRSGEIQRAVNPPAPAAAAAPARGPKTPRAAGASSRRQARPRRASASGKPAAPADGVLALGATDITGNKELPKVMVIVPWKDPSGAGGVIKPADSLMNEVLEPVDRGVFQRRIRYYGQLDAAAGPAADGSENHVNKPATPPPGVAPVGDKR